MRLLILMFLGTMTLPLVVLGQSLRENPKKNAETYELTTVDFIPRQIYLIDTDKDSQTIGIVALTNGNLHALDELGVQIHSQIGSIITARVPIDIFDSIRNSPDIIACEPAGACHQNLDISAARIGARIVTQGMGLTGAGVIIGIVDSDIDITNPDFQNGPNDSRIIYFWNQNGSTDPKPYPFNYGTEYTKNDIDNGSCNFVGVSAHGTMVTGIAAGNGRNGSAFCGIAPQSDIIFVNYKGGAGGSTAKDYIIDAANYIVDKATARNQPCVINLSLSSNLGTRDGSSLFDMALDSILTNHSGKGLV